MKKDMFFNCPTGEATEGGRGAEILKVQRPQTFQPISMAL